MASVLLTSRFLIQGFTCYVTIYHRVLLKPKVNTMTPSSQISLEQDVINRAASYLANALRDSEADAAALFTLDGQCAWASDPAFQRIAPNIARIGIASLRLWAKSRKGKLEQIGLVTNEGIVDLIFVPPLASLLVVSSKSGHSGWPEGEPAGMLEAIGLAK